MTKRGSYVGIDVMKPVVPTQEKLAEQDAEDEAGSFFEHDLSTVEGAAKSVRPAGVLLAVKAVFSLFLTVYVGVSADWSQLLGSDLDEASYEAVNTPALLSLDYAIAAIWATALSVFVFLRSRIAAVLAALWVAIMWIAKVMIIASGDMSGLTGGTIFLLLLTATVGWAVAGSFAYHRLKTSPDAP